MTSLPPEWYDVSLQVCGEVFCCCPCCKITKNYSEIEEQHDSSSDLTDMLKESMYFESDYYHALKLILEHTETLLELQ